MPGPERDVWVDFVAGWLAGAAAVALCQPLDTVLTIVQNLPPAANSTGAAVLRQVWSQPGGVLALWRGALPMMLVVPLQNSLLFAGYGIGCRASASASANADAGGSGGGDDAAAKEASPSLHAVFTGGLLGGILQCLVVSPAELLKVRRQVRLVEPAYAAAQASTAAMGPRRMLTVATRGLGATVLRDGVPHGVWFAAYEWAKQRMARNGGGTNGDGDDVPAAVALLSGGYAAAVAWAVGYPFDTVKTRIQAARGEGQRSIVTVMRQMAREGKGSFYRGFGLKLLRAVPASAVSFYVYESAKRFLNDVQLPRLPAPGDSAKAALASVTAAHE